MRKCLRVIYQTNLYPIGKVLRTDTCLNRLKGSLEEHGIYDHPYVGVIKGHVIRMAFDRLLIPAAGIRFNAIFCDETRPRFLYCAEHKGF